jgi:lysyl-tRNA synthetase class I
VNIPLDVLEESWDSLNEEMKEKALYDVEVPRCPKCGRLKVEIVFGDWYDNDNVELVCEKCGHEFNVSVDITTSYSNIEE